jgi:hypothetical protein
MRNGLARQGSRKVITGILLVVLAFRALVPAGFMPAPNRAFSLAICPDGFPTQLLHHAIDDGHGVHHAGGASHSHGAARSEHCVFAAVVGAGPSTDALVVHLPPDNLLASLFDTPRSAFRSLRFFIQQPRAPPVPA